MKDIKKSENEVTVLGFNAAGWGTLEKVEKKRLGVLDPNVSNPEESGSKVYGFGATPVPDEESIYHRCHIGKEMSEQKKEIIERFALTVLVASIEHLPLESKNNLINGYNLYNKKILGGSDDDAIPLIPISQSDRTLSEHLPDFSIALSYFIKGIGCLAPLKADTLQLTTQEEEKYLYFQNTLDQLEVARPHSKARLQEYTSTNHESLQDTMWHSKRIIADTLQENIRRYQHDEPLIPIKMVISSTHTGAEFNPDPDNQRTIAEKKDAYISPTEVRFMYKMMEEMPDEEIKHIMKETVTFLERDGEESFREIPAPWDASWENRPRGQRGEAREPYAIRGELPKWVKQLIDFKEKNAQQDNPTPGEYS